MPNKHIIYYIIYSTILYTGKRYSNFLQKMHFVINIFIGQKVFFFFFFWKTARAQKRHWGFLAVASALIIWLYASEAPSGRVDKSQRKAASCETQTHCAFMCESVCQRLMGFYGLLCMAGSQKLLPMKLWSNLWRVIKQSYQH